MRASVPALAALLCLALVPTASADDVAPCQGPNEYVYEDVRDTMEGDVQCGSLSDPCYRDESCGGCGPDLLEWIGGPIHC